MFIIYYCELLDNMLHEYYPQFRPSLLIESFFTIYDNLEKYSLVSIQVRFVIICIIYDVNELINIISSATMINISIIKKII